MARKTLEYKKGDLVSSISDIQYTLISKEGAFVQNYFFGTTFSLLRELPKNLLQLKDSWHFFKFSYHLVLRKGINLYMLPDVVFSKTAQDAVSIFEDLSNHYNRDLVKIFIIDSEIINHQSVSEFLRLIPFSYYHIVGPISNESLGSYDQAKRFEDTHHLISLLKNDLPSINFALQEGDKALIEDFKLLSHKNVDDLNPYHANPIAETNYFIANQFLANFWFKKPEVHTTDAIDFYKKKGLGIQLDQIQKIDTMHSTGHELSRASPMEPLHPSMIIVAPYHFPRMEEMLYKQIVTNDLGKMLIRAIHSEQKHNYDFIETEEMVSSLSEVAISTSLDIEEKNLRRLDHLAYLHSQLNNSPVLRLPAIGRSLGPQLSRFTGELSEYEDQEGKQRAVAELHDLGTLMSRHLIHENVKSTLKDRDGQLVCLTDLPIEWMKLGDFPLSLTHDVCRIPEYNLNSAINIYIKNQRMVFRIEPEIVKRTLIVHCASNSEVDLHEVFDSIDELQVALGFNSVRCKTVKEVSVAIKKYKPDLLIFDCHGNFEEKGLSSFLTLDFDNGIELTGDDIISNEISAPLVFISACRTQPNYGYVKLLSDAFFQAGAFSVTCTYLPIFYDTAASLIIRMLTELRTEANSFQFTNWLAFISHTLRSSLVIDTIQKIHNENESEIDIHNDIVKKILSDFKLFKNREKAIVDLKNHLRSIDSKSDLTFEKFEHDWLFYTTLGRADLIYFEKWLNKHQTAGIRNH